MGGEKCKGDTQTVLKCVRKLKYPHTPYVLGAAARRPLVQLGGDCTWCFATQPHLLSLLMIAAAAPRHSAFPCSRIESNSKVKTALIKGPLYACTAVSIYVQGPASPAPEYLGHRSLHRLRGRWTVACGRRGLGLSVGCTFLGSHTFRTSTLGDIVPSNHLIPGKQTDKYLPIQRFLHDTAWVLFQEQLSVSSRLTFL